MWRGLFRTNQFHGEFLHSVEVPLAAPELRNGFDAEHGTRLHKRRNARLAQTAGEFFGIEAAVALDQEHNAFALDGVWDCGNGKFVFAHNACLCNAEFHGSKRNHFATELCKAAVAAKNLYESVLGDGALVARLVPTASIDFEDDVFGELLLAETDIPQEEKGILLDFGEVLGTSDICGQLSGIAAQKSLMQEYFG